MFKRLPILAILALIFTSCGPSATSIEIYPVGETMEFATKSFTVKSGQEVTLTMKNTATSPAMQHNIVILTSMSDLAVTQVGSAAVMAADKGYIPESDEILAYTAMAGPGEVQSVTFVAPAPGKYRYICTFPGHYALMQGTMIVE